MSCFPELTYAIYADGELPPEERRAVETHLSACGRCRQRVASLRAENQLLSAALQQPAKEPAPAHGRLRPRELAWAAAAVLLAAAGLETVLSSLAELEALPQLDWLNPLGVGFQSNLFFTSFFYVQEGGAMLLTAVQNLALFLLGASALAGGLFWLRRRMAGASLLLASLLLMLMPRPGWAFETRHGERGELTIAAGETVNDTLFAAGATVNLDGTVNGDAFLFGESVKVRGTVKGNLLCFARSVELAGQVDGTVACFAQLMRVTGGVARNHYTFTQLLLMEADGRVEQDLTAFALNVEIRGAIGRHLTAVAQRVALSAQARLGGNLTAHVPRRELFQVASGATVGGKTDVRLPRPRPSRYARAGFYLWQAIWLGAAFLTGLLLRWLFPAFLDVSVAGAGAVLRAMGVGFLILVATPVALVLVGITMLGLPAALLGAGLYIAALYLAKVFAGLWLGRTLLARNDGGPSFAVVLVAGLAIVFVAANLPYAGGWVSFLALLLGLGLAYTQARRAWRPA